METCHQESGEEGKLHRIGSPALAEDEGEVMAETGVVAEGEDGRLCHRWPVRLGRYLLAKTAPNTGGFSIHAQEKSYTQRLHYSSSGVTHFPADRVQDLILR
jgi:hypothetical protein